MTSPPAFSWYCLPETVDAATEFRPRRVYRAYCGAPPGVRGRCSAQLRGHDPGDEDPGEGAARLMWRPAP